MYACFKQNFRNLRARESGSDHFLMKLPKGTSLADLTRFEPLRVQIRSRFFLSRRPAKQGTIQKVTGRLYFAYLWGILH